MNNADIIAPNAPVYLATIFGLTTVFFCIGFFGARRGRKWYKERLLYETENYFLEKINIRLQFFINVVSYYFKDEDTISGEMISNVFNRVIILGGYSDYWNQISSIVLRLLRDHKRAPVEVIDELEKIKDLISDLARIQIEKSINGRDYENRLDEARRIFLDLDRVGKELLILHEKTKDDQVEAQT